MKETYLAQYARQPKLGGKTKWLDALRQTAIDHFASQGFPTTRLEAWRRTDVSSIAKTEFTEPNGAQKKFRKEQLRGFLPAAWEQHPHLVFLNGRYAPDLSNHSSLPSGIQLQSLKQLLKNEPARVEPYLGKKTPLDQHPFAALNTAFLQDGAYVQIPRGASLETPIYLVHVSRGEKAATISHPRNLIVAEANSQAKVIEVFVGPETGAYFTNAVTEIIAHPNAVLEHVKLQLENRQAFHTGLVDIWQDRSQVTNHSVSFGGSLVRHDITAHLNTEGCESTLNGLYLTNETQHMDHHTTIDHAQPHCLSRELYKGILAGRSRGVFNGRILVRPDAQKTDSRQSNKNLLLSPDALVDTTPQLEIFADDVKCAHGATIGKLAETELFYLRSRGLDETAARKLLIHAFASEMISHIKIDTLAPFLGELVAKRFSALEQST